MKRKIYAIDIDGVIADGKFWMEDCTPRTTELEAANMLYKQGHTIIYHTARHPQHYALTYAWLVKHGAYFHALEMGKLTADFYIDDRNMSVEKLLGRLTEDKIIGKLEVLMT